MAQQIQWKWIDGYPEYSVSTTGEVIRKCWLTLRNGRMEVRGGYRLKHHKSKQGYVSVSLFVFDGKKTNKGYLIHRLVAAAFIPNPDNKPFVNHINGIKSDNRVENLEWCTRLENQRHAVVNGLYKNPKGANHRMAKLKDEDVFNIIKEYDSGNVTQYQLANKYGVAQTMISRIVRKENWTHLFK